MNQLKSLEILAMCFGSAFFTHFIELAHEFHSLRFNQKDQRGNASGNQFNVASK